MDANAKGKFLRKIAINGFSIEEKEDVLILRPRGAEATASVSIREDEEGVWAVVDASGSYGGFRRGKKKGYFETYVNQWAMEALFQSRE